MRGGPREEWLLSRLAIARPGDPDAEYAAERGVRGPRAWTASASLGRLPHALLSLELLVRSAMKLEPVFLLAPSPNESSPRPPTTFSRRSLWFASAAAAIGGCLGGGLLRGLLSGGMGLDRAEVDPSVEWAFGLQDGTLETLLAGRDGFLAVVSIHRLPQLRIGVERLAVAAVSGAGLDRSSAVTLARSLLALVDGMPELRITSDLLDDLRRVR